MIVPRPSWHLENSGTKAHHFSQMDGQNIDDDSHKICIKYYRKNLKDNIILMTKHSFGEFAVLFRYEYEVPG